jgi:hypothetical protein
MKREEKSLKLYNELAGKTEKGKSCKGISDPGSVRSKT